MMDLEEVKSGFTSSSFLAVLYSVLVFIPAVMYLNLVTGVVGLSVAWFVLILWAEIARISGRPITRQEAIMIYILSGAEIYLPISMVYRAYLRNSDIAQLFGIANQIPTWWAPSPETGVWVNRTFLHPAWFTPIAITLGTMLLSVALGMSLGVFGYGLFSRVEKLPFPLQRMVCEGVESLASGRKRVRYLFFFGLIGFIYGTIVYAVPFILEAYTGQEMRIIPIPYLDLNTAIERFLPGAAFGIATDLWPIASAFVLPPSIVVSIATASIGIYTFGNWLAVAYDLAPVKWWLPGMSLEMTLQRSILYFWAAPIVGLGLAAGIVPILRHPGSIKKAFGYLSGRSSSSKSSDTLISTKVFLVPFILCSVAGIGLFMWLAPEFPVWIIAPIIVAMPFIETLTSGRTIGEAGIGFAAQATTVSRLAYLGSGYKGVDVWFVPNISGGQTTGGWLPNISGGHTGGGWLKNFKMMELTHTRTSSFVKMYLLCLPIAVVVGYIFVQLFWTLAPIPSGRYPGAAIFWPINAIQDILWIKGVEIGLFQPLWILIAFVVGAGLYLFTSLPFIPLSFISMAAGATIYPPFAVTYLVGTVIALTIRRFTGIKWWEENKMLLSAGLMMGEGIAVSLSVCIVLVTHSIWVLPY